MASNFSLVRVVPLAVVLSAAGGCGALLGLGDFVEGPAGGGGDGGSTTSVSSASSVSATASSSGATGGASGCPIDKAECGGAPGDCETSIDTDPLNCGGCGKACDATNAESATCKSSSCVLVCSAGYENCNSDAKDGCEATLDNDQANCGACGHSCSGACAGGKCQPLELASAQNTPTELAVDSSSVYWANTGSGEFLKVSIDGGMAQVMTTSAVPGNVRMVISPTEMFWASLDKNVYKTSLAGGGPMKIVGGVTFAGASDLAVTPTDLYLTSGNDLLKLQGVGNTTTLASDPGGFGSIAIDANFAYYSAQGKLRKAPLSGGPPTDVCSLPTMAPVTVIAVDASMIYVSIFDDGSGKPALMSVDKGGAGLGKVVTPSEIVNSFVVDAKSIYWAELTAGKILKAPLLGGAVTTLAAGQDSPLHLAISGKHVYWTNYGAFNGITGKVMKLEIDP